VQLGDLLIDLDFALLSQLGAKTVLSRCVGFRVVDVDGLTLVVPVDDGLTVNQGVDHGFAMVRDLLHLFLAFSIDSDADLDRAPHVPVPPSSRCAGTLRDDGSERIC
jgi:hypothetical protein